MTKIKLDKCIQQCDKMLARTKLTKEINTGKEKKKNNLHGEYKREIKPQRAQY